MTCVTYQELLARGWSPQRVRTAVAHGRLTRIRQDAYVVGRPGWLAQTAAMLAALPAAIASHSTAAALWGVADEPSCVEVTAPHRTALRPEPGLCVHRTTRPVSWVVVRGVRVTSPARTVVDLGRRVPLVDGVIVADAALQARLCTAADLAAAVTDVVGLAGARRAASAAAVARLGAGSPMETRLRLAFAAARLPEPELQVPVATARRTYHADIGWPAQRVVVEYDGVAHHAGDLGFARDRQRWRDMQAADWWVIPVSAGDTRDMHQLVDEVRIALARRATTTMRVADR